MSRIYLGAVAFGLTLLVASFVLGGKDTDHGDGEHAPSGDLGFGWAPITSLRFWIFMLAFGGGAGLALEQLGSSRVVSAIGASAFGWAAGVIAVTAIRRLSKNSVSSEMRGADAIGTTGILTLPVAKGSPGKVRIEQKGRSEDFVANLVDDGEAMPTGTSVLVVSEGEHGSLVVTKGDM